MFGKKKNINSSDAVIESKQKTQLDLIKRQKEFKKRPLPEGVSRTSAEKQDKNFKEVSSLLTDSQIELIQSISTGNYCEVYFGLNLGKCEFNAIKVIDQKTAFETFKIRVLPRELNVLQRVKHINIINIYEVKQLHNKVFIEMEFINGGDVCNYLRKNGAIAENVVQRLFKSIVNGLRYMHGLGIAHRNLKAENILLDKHFVPKLSDFSHSRNVDFDDKNEVKLSETFCGSIAYFPPELLELKKYNAFKYDIWSTGVLLYLMLFNSFPFNPENEKQMIENQFNRKWNFKLAVSDEVKDILKKLLEPEEDNRCTTTSLFMHRWLKNIEPMFRP